MCPRAEAFFGNFWLGAAYSSAVSFGVKLTAIAMQQKIIGERLGTRVTVRRAVQVNSPTMKAIKLILNKPGMSFGKVMILVGGPDWPTSVTTGIMKLSVFQMLLGSLPHGLPISLVVFAGGMQMKTAEGGIWWALGSLPSRYHLAVVTDPPLRMPSVTCRTPLSDVFLLLATLIYPVR